MRQLLKYSAYSLLFCLSVHIAQAQDTTLAESQVLDIEDNNRYQTFSLLDEATQQYKIFFTGENHTFKASNAQLELKMFKYLHQKVGLRNFLMELGHSRGWLVNEYVQTGDTALFNILKLYSYKEFSELYRKLRAYNQIQDSAHKIRIIGIDMEREYTTAIKVLSLCIPEETPPDELRLSMESIRSLEGYIAKRYKEYVDSDDDFDMVDFKGFSSERTVEALIEDFNEHQDIYKSYLGEKYDLFRKIMVGLEAEHKRSEYTEKRMAQARLQREIFIYDRFMEVLNQYPNERFFGQFGRFHTATNEQGIWGDTYNFNSLASRINNTPDKRIQDKVCSIGIYYSEKSYRELDNIDVDELALLQDQTENKQLRLFKIAGKDDVYQTLTNKFQFVIVSTMPQEDSDDDDTYDTGNLGLYTTYGHFDFGYGTITPNLDQLNLLYTNSNLSTLPQSLDYLSFGFSVYENHDLYFNIASRFIIPVERTLNDSTNSTFSGSDIFMHIGKDLTANERVNLILAGGIGYGQMRLSLEEEQRIQSGTTNILTERKATLYKNPAFIADINVDFHINIKFMSIGFKAGYQFDLSNKTWQNSLNEQVVNGPESSFSGFYSSANLSFFFTD